MQRIPANIYNGELGNAAASVYTSPANTKTTIAQATVSNITAGAVTFSCAVSQTGSAPFIYVYHAITLASNETRVLSGLVGMTLEAGGQIELWASAATSLDASLSGYATTV